MRVYIAGPYTARTTAARRSNVKRAIDAALALLAKGHAPFIPHLTHFVDQQARARGIQISWDAYIKWDLQWLDLCDWVLYLGPSKGADTELARAKAMGKRVFLSIAEVPAHDVNMGDAPRARPAGQEIRRTRR